jgi:energy-coupling factor transporter transmembrane protein EcfT
MSVGERTPLILSDNSNINDHDVFSEDGQLVDISDKGEKEIWDFVIAFPATEEAQYKIERRNMLQQQLEAVGLIVNKVESYDAQTYFLLIRASEERLEEQAALISMHLELKAEYGKGACAFTIAKRDLFERKDGGALFSKTNRQYLINSIITSDDVDGGAEMDLQELQFDEIITKSYPLHEYKVMNTIINDWVKNRSLGSIQNMPIDQLHNYFGAELAFYYGWLAFYTKWLVVMSIVGTVAFIIGNAHIPGENKWTNSVYSVFVAIWVSLFLEYWKRERNTLAWRWHMLHYEEDEGVRPSFRGEDKIGAYARGEFVDLRPDEIYGTETPKLTRFYPSESTRRKKLSGLGIIMVLSFMVAIATMAVLTLRVLMENSQNFYTKTAASFNTQCKQALLLLS